MKTLFRNNKAFLTPYVLFLIAGAVLIIINSKSDTHLEFNRFHNSFCDVFFRYLTNLGDGFAALIVIIIAFTVKYRYALIIGISNLVSGIITQTLKHTLFSEVVRPKKFFEGIHDIYFVPHVDNYLYNSFPSGHSTCAFALYFSLALITERKLYKFLFFLLALSVAYSRIYLSQHFFEDIYAGSLIGVTTTLFTFTLINKNQSPKLDNSLRNLKSSI